MWEKKAYCVWLCKLCNTQRHSAFATFAPSTGLHQVSWGPTVLGAAWSSQAPVIAGPLNLQKTEHKSVVNIKMWSHDKRATFLCQRRLGLGCGDHVQ